MPFIGSGQIGNFVLRVLVPLTSSRFFVHIAQPLAIFSSFAIIGAWEVLKKMFPVKRIFIAVAIVFLLTAPSLVHSYNVSRPFLSASIDQNGWNAISFICDELPGNASVLTDFAVGETLIQKCNKQFLAYYNYAKNPRYVEKTWGYMISEKNLTKTMVVFSNYKITHILLDKNVKSFYISGRTYAVDFDKFQNTECFKKTFESGSLEIYEADFSCSEFKGVGVFEKTIEDEIESFYNKMEFA